MANLKWYQKRTSAVTLIFWVYVLSMFLDGIHFVESDGKPGGVAPGWLILILGWLAPLYGNLNPAWFANPLLVTFLVTAKNHVRLAREAAVIGFALALTALFLNKIHSDGGVVYKVSHLGIGYYVWLFCFLVAFLATYLKVERRVLAGTPSAGAADGVCAERSGNR